MKCSICNKYEELWIYLPNGKTACDECVPRGCSCGYDLRPDFEEFDLDGNYNEPGPEDYIQQLDECGRPYPCCEWEHINRS